MREPDGLPDGWQATTLGGLGKYLNGRAFKTSEWAKTGRPIIRIQDLTGSNRNPNYYEGEAEERHTIREGDLLVSWSATLGAYIWDGPEAVLNQHIFKVESNIDKRFHYHLLRNAIAELVRNAHGSGMVHVTKGIFDDMPVAVPESPSLQDAIAKIIDRADEFQASASSHLVAARSAIELFKRAVLIAACSGRLTEDWRSRNSELLSSELETGADGIKALVEVPDSWTWRRLSDVSDIRGGIQKGAKVKAGDVLRDVPYLRVANVQRGWLDLNEMKLIGATEKKIAELRLEPGDIFFTEGGDIDKLGRGWIWEGQIEECIHQNHVFRARLRDSHFEPKFFSWYGNTIGAAYFLSGGKQTVNLASLNMTTLKALPVPIPCPEEQAEIVRQVESLLSIADVLLSRIDLASGSVERSSQAVLAKAFRGQLSPAGL